MAYSSLRWVFVFVIASSLTTGCKGEGSGAPPAGAMMNAPAPAAPFVAVSPESVVVSDTLSGRVSALREAEVRPQVSGILRERLFTEGEFVQAGQELYRIDSDLFRADVSSSSSANSRARATLERAEQELARVTSLNERGVSTGRELEIAQTNVNVARADVQQTSAALRRNRLTLQYAKVTAPIEGRISISRASEGALVSPADPQPLTLIQQLDEVYVDVKQPLRRYEEIRHSIAAGSLVEQPDALVTVLSSDGTVYSTEGKLLFADATVDRTTSEVTLRVLVPNPDLVLLPGTFVRARVPLGVAKDMVRIPQQAVRHDPTFGPYVYLIGADNLVERRSVRYSGVVDGQYVITEGLNAGERVVVENHNNMRPGAPVTPQPWGSAVGAAPAAPAPTPAEAAPDAGEPTTDDATPEAP